ncbi:MAG: lipid A biosynthesis (KDO)2-(lauroyl)-lipid IVA acyltransferase [Bacteroidales bacterium]|jgi:predicted LPLAT superfamily acyltransferase|nr:lipid A biosynthesis (KDO)2-(lauroyl)-lipid IVA acyltransferase [Bacteroidales bacterium]
MKIYNTLDKTKNWQGVTGGKKLGQKSLLLLFHLTNVTVGYFFLALVVPFYMLFRRKGYLAIYRYFRKHFSYSPLKSFLKTYHNHFIFGQCMLDRFAVYAGKKNFFKMKISGDEHFHKLLESEKGFIIASSHVGNFELSGCLLKQEIKRINVLVFGGETKEIMENRSKLFNSNNICIIPVFDDNISHIFAVKEALSEGEAVSMTCDRNLGSTKCVKSEFLSGNADFPIGAFTLAAHFNVPVIAIFMMKKSVSNYNIYVKPISYEDDGKISKKEKAIRLTHKYVKELDAIVRKYPEQWFNFYEFWKEHSDDTTIKK